MILGLTGGIASGKTTVSNYLKEKGMEVFDADEISRDFIKDKSIKEEIRIAFGNSVFSSNGEVNKEILKDIVFNNEKKREKLNSIFHPKIEKIINFKVNEHKKKIEKNKNNIKFEDKLLILDIPLLFEAKLEKYCDKIIVVILDLERQIERVIKRDDISHEFALKIVNSQMPMKEKIERSDFIISNNGTLEELKIEIDYLLNRIRDVE